MLSRASDKEQSKSLVFFTVTGIIGNMYGFHFVDLAMKTIFGYSH